MTLRRDGNMIRKAKMGEMQSQGRECQKLEEAREGFSPRAS